MLRRTPIKRSRIKPKPRKKTPILEQYRSEHPPDEILFYLGVRLFPNGGMYIEKRGQWEPRDEVHHIFGGQGRRPDLRSNLIGVNSEGHDGKHDGKRNEGNRYTVLCLLAKKAKAMAIGNLLEFHYEDLRQACGHLILPIIESVTFEDAHLESERRELEKIIRNIESD